MQTGAASSIAWLLVELNERCVCCFTCVVWLEDPTAYEDPKAWVQGWVRLATAISKVGSYQAMSYWSLLHHKVRVLHQRTQGITCYDWLVLMSTTAGAAVQHVDMPEMPVVELRLLFATAICWVQLAMVPTPEMFLLTDCRTLCPVVLSCMTW